MDEKSGISHFYSIGDSITSGHPDHQSAEERDGVEKGDETSQYQYYLGKLLNATFTNLGWGGQTTVEIAERIDRIPDNSDVFLQGGLNDDPNSIPAQTTFENFKDMYSSLTSRGCRVYILSLTPHTVRNWSETYQEVNSLLRTWTDREKIPYFEIYDLLLAPGSTYLPNPEYFADTVHPNHSGYQLIGEMIFDNL
ncbi:MAG: SGNH/GDSL hydrolase family protein [Thermoplasmatota archaeon]